MTAAIDAVQDAVTCTLPLYEMARMRLRTCPRRLDNGLLAGEDPSSTLRWVNGFRHTRALLTPRNREVVTPNNDTLYDNAWLDLHDGPLLIDVPDMADRYWTLGFLDMWTNPFAYAGRRATGNRAQRLFVHGPGWTGDVPAGAVRIAAPGDDVWIIGRMLADTDPADLTLAHALQAGYAIRRPGDGASAWSRFDAALVGDTQDVPPADLYRCTVREVMQRNPDASAEAHAALIERVAIEALADALQAVYTGLRRATSGTAVGGGWTIPVTVRTGYGQDFDTRARVARNLIGALGIEEAMYAVCDADADGLPLDGGSRYELRFAPGQWPKVDAFWSLTAYRRRDCLLIDNPIERYSIGDRTRGLVIESDGSLVIRLQGDDPGAGVNWLPTAADDASYVTLRLYQPRAEHLDGAFRYPPVRRIAD